VKVLTVMGARPQFIKAAAARRVLLKQCEEILVHTGQRYDANMSAVFFYPCAPAKSTQTR